MTFNSVFFLCVFLPLALLVYYVLPRRLRPAALVLVSLVFYAWGQPAYLALLLFSVVFNYLTGLQLGLCRAQERPARAKGVLLSAVIVNLLVLGFFKYYGFLLENLNAVLGTALRDPGLPLPVGVSFFTFSALSYVFDVYRGRCGAQKSFVSFALYMTFFPKLTSGPIEQYADMERQLAAPSVSGARLAAGAATFLAGLMKKVLIADNLGTAFTAISALSDRSVVTAWLGMIFYSLQLYFDFSGYSDMAIGLGRMFGFELKKNFDYPYLSASVSEFWRRWHISLGAWFRDYVYIPLGGNRCGKARQALNLAVVWLLTGIWHGASWTFVVWGLYHGAFILLEKFVLRGRQERLPRPLRVGVTVLIAFVGWVFFFSPTFGGALTYIGQLFGAGSLGFLDGTARYYLSGNLLLLVIAVLGCGPLARNLYRNFCFRQGKGTAVSLACTAALFLGCVAYLISATYSSFLYFQF